MGFLLLVAPFLTAGPSGSSGSGRLDPLLVAGLLTAGCSRSDSLGFGRFNPPLVVSFVSVACSGDDSVDAGRLDPFLLSFFTAGVLGFLAGAPLLMGVALGGGGEGSFVVFFLADRMAEGAAFLAGDFFARERPLPFAFD